MSRAITLLKEYGKIVILSSVWRSAAVGPAGPEFLNAAVLFHSPLSSQELRMQVLRKIEKQLGRVRISDKNAARPIDIDILICDDEVLDSSIWETAHLAVPLAEINPDYKHSSTGESIESAAQRLSSETKITIIGALISD